jgi:hypothetical protein
MKKLIVIMIGVLLIVGYLLASGFLPECKDTDTGWECRFNNDLMKELYQTQCHGYFHCTAMCFTYFCDLPYDDAGKECSSSEQCKGHCVVDTSYIKQNYPNMTWITNCSEPCSGTCSKYPLRTCDWWYEVNNSTIEQHAVMCD